MLEITDPIYRTVALCQSKNFGPRNRESLAEQQPDDSRMRDDDDALVTVIECQRIKRAKNANAHLLKAFSMRKLSFSWTRHPGFKNVRVSFLDFFVCQAFEVAKVDLCEILHWSNRQAMRFGDDSSRVECAPQMA